MDFIKTHFIQLLQSIKSPKVIFSIAFCVNVILLLLFNSTFNTDINPEFIILKIFIIFTLLFLAELSYLIFSHYNLKNAFLYSFTSNYAVCILYYLTYEQIISFCYNLADADSCCFINGALPTALRIYVVRSTWIEHLFIFLLFSALLKILLFKLFNYKNFKKGIFDFLIINFTFIIFYFSLSDTYVLLKDSIKAYYNNQYYSEETFKLYKNHFFNDNEINSNNSKEVVIHNKRIEAKKKLYSKPNNLLSKILDLFINTK